MKKIILIAGIILLYLQPTVKAQYIIKKADEQFELYNYNNAIVLYEQAWKKKETKHAAARLAFCYKMQQNYKQAESWAALATGQSNSTSEDALNYARALQENGKYNEAKIQYYKYWKLDQKVNPEIVNRWIQSCDSAVRWMKDAATVEILNEKALNSTHSEWGLVKRGDNIIFVSNRPAVISIEQKTAFFRFDGTKLPNKRVDGFTGESYLKLFIKKKDDSITDFPVGKEMNYHKGPASFTADGKQMFFTATVAPEKASYQKIDVVRGKLATATMGIYKALKDENGNWSEAEPFKYNSAAYSNSDPFISNDGKYLYFCSNMPEGKGGTDIYVSAKNKSGEWSAPVNLKEVNTEGNERSPFFDQANNFYFSSDGYIGMGGLDIYVSILRSGQISQPINLGYPLNSPQDDFSFVLDTDGSGYFASNRNNGMGKDDIYHFIKQKAAAYKLVGTVFAKGTHLPLANAIVTLKGQENGQLQFQTDSTGKFKFNLDRETAYQLLGEKTGFRNDLAKISTKGLPIVAANLNKDIYLEEIVINKGIRIENIYYDFDDAEIRPDAAKELDKLVKIMKDNPTIWIEIGAHTDSRGNDKYNLKLSQKRAEAVVQYLVSNGIEKNRLTAVGYGETMLLNKCVNEVNCTEEQHQLNRRTEFKIVKQ